MKNLTLIGGGNGNSSVLELFYENPNFEKFYISSIVSMSDDGRTTGLLMRQMQKGLGVHMPPPGDLRRCLFALSNSKFRKNFKKLFETVLKFEGKIFEGKIKDFSIFNILEKLNIDRNFIKKFEEIKNLKLNLDFPISGHKFGNLLMANLYYNFDKDYNKMMNFMHQLLEVKGNIIPITTDSAFIQAKLENGEMIKTQDKISNVADYDSNIIEIGLMQNSINAKLNKNIDKIIENSDYIIITPGDLYTSILSNFIIDNFSEKIKNSNKKIIFILNSNNKKGETTGYKPIDFVNKIIEKIGKIDYIFGNNHIPELTLEELENLKNDISVKGGDFLILDEKNKKEILQKYPNIKITSGKYVDDHGSYKYNKNLVKDLIGVL